MKVRGLCKVGFWEVKGLANKLEWILLWLHGSPLVRNVRKAVRAARRKT